MTARIIGRHVTLWTTLVAAATTLIAPNTLARAQAPETVSHLVTNVDEAPLRSGADLAWYVVAQIDRATTLRMSGEIDNWFRVEYPAGTPAVVKITDAELNDAQDRVVLTRRSSLLAINLLNPYMEDCYKRLFAEQPLPPGTELEYLGPMENRRGILAGYMVVAPAGAQGYILPANVRPATPDEVRALEGAPEPPPPDPTPTQARTTPAGTPDYVERTPTPEHADDDPEFEEVVVVVEDDEDDEGVLEMTAATPDPPIFTAAGSVEDLEDAYRRVIIADINIAEFEQLITEYRALRATLPRGEEAAIERDFIDARIEILRIRTELQDSMLRLALLEAEAASAELDIVDFVRRAQAARGYVVVGRFAPSIIYDGQRLPRMFRVVSVDNAAGGRTLAYILPVDEIGLVGKLGELVGVMGEDDPTASRGSVRVIRPTAVDILNTSTD